MSVSILFCIVSIVYCQVYDAGSHDRIMFYTNPTRDFKTDTPKSHNGLIYYAGESIDFDKVIHVYNGTTGAYSDMIHVSTLKNSTKGSFKVEDLVFLFYRRIQSRSESIIAYNTVQRTIAWKYEQSSAAIFEPSPLFQNGYIYFLQAFAGVLDFIGLKASSGKVMWKISNLESQPFCSYISGEEKCASVPLKDAKGKVIDMTGNWGTFKQPAYANGTLYVNLQTTLLAFDADKGTLKWSTDLNDEYSVQRFSPHAYGEMVYTIAFKEYACNKTFNSWPYWTCSEAPYNFFALSSITGDILWTRDFTEELYTQYFWYHWYEIGQHIVYHPEKDLLYVSVKYFMHKPNPYFQLYSINAKTGEDVWNIDMSTNQDQSYRSLWDAYQNSFLFINKNTLYHVDTSTGLVRGINALVGDQVWQEPTGIRFSNGILADKSLYLSQQHISESIVSTKDNYILGISLDPFVIDTIGNCSWNRNSALYNQSKVVLYNRYCGNGKHAGGHNNPVKPQKSNQLLGDFLGVVIATTIAVLF